MSMKRGHHDIKQSKYDVLLQEIERLDKEE